MGNLTIRQMRAVTSAALTVAALSSACPARAQLADSAETKKAVSLINQRRADSGEPALVRNCSLDELAFHTIYGQNPATGTGTPANVIGPLQDAALEALKDTKTITKSGASAEEVVAAWTSDPSTLGLIHSSSYTQIGMFVSSRGGAKQWVAVFGNGNPTTCEYPDVESYTRSLGGVATSAPRAAYDGGHLFVFVRGTDGAVWYRSRSDRSGDWAGWRSIGGFIKGNLALGRVGSGSGSRLAVFVRGADDALWYAQHDENPLSESAFSQWISLGGLLTSDPVVQQQSDGNACVFVRGTDGALWYRKQSRDIVSNLLIQNNWSNWQSLGGNIVGAPLVSRGSDGQLIILARGTNNSYSQRQDPELDAGADPSKLWSTIDFSWGLSEWEGDVLIAPGSRASSLALLCSYASNSLAGENAILSQGFQGGVYVYGGPLGQGVDTTIFAATTGRMAVARRLVDGFYLCFRRTSDKICVVSAEVRPEEGVRELGAPEHLASRAGSADLCVVTSPITGRPIVFCLDEKGGVEERWF